MGVYCMTGQLLSINLGIRSGSLDIWHIYIHIEKICLGSNVGEEKVLRKDS